MLQPDDLTPQQSSEPAAAGADGAPPQRQRKRKRRRSDRATIGCGIVVVLALAGLCHMHWQTKDSLTLLGEADATTATLNGLLAGGKESIAALSVSIRQTRASVDRFTQRDDAQLATLRASRRDPFQFESIEATHAPAALPGGNTHLSGREQARATALAAARQLQLQSIMYGSTRRSCLIDGKLFFEGQPLGEFTIHRIAQDAVTLQCGEFRFELRLRR